MRGAMPQLAISFCVAVNFFLFDIFGAAFRAGIDLEGRPHNAVGYAYSPVMRGGGEGINGLIHGMAEKRQKRRWAQIGIEALIKGSRRRRTRWPTKTQQLSQGTHGSYNRKVHTVHQASIIKR